ncbi:MAG TPA: hypothetical protein VGD43_00035 [Micromonospora sp.]
MADGLSLALAIIGVACLPVVIAMAICLDEILDRVVCGLAEWREQRARRRTIDELNRAVNGDLATAPTADLSALDHPDRPAIEQIAADLRRLGRQRLSARNRSGVWSSAVLQAYDERLRQACRCLGVPEHLADLDGVDLEIERVRVEGELQKAGLVLPAPASEPRPRQH